MRVLVLAAFSVVVLMVVSSASCGGKVVLDAPTSTGTGGVGGAGAGGFFGSSGGAFGGAGGEGCLATGDACDPAMPECCSGLACDSSNQCD